MREWENIFWRCISVKLEITFLNLFKVWLGKCHLCIYDLVLQSRSVVGVPVVWVCARVKGAKSVVMLVNDLRIECTMYLSRFFFPVWNVVSFWPYWYFIQHEAVKALIVLGDDYQSVWYSRKEWGLLKNGKSFLDLSG